MRWGKLPSHRAMEEIELIDDDLDKCPKCGCLGYWAGKTHSGHNLDGSEQDVTVYDCGKCGHEWTI